MNVTDRNGNLVPYSRDRIINAIKKAFEVCEYDIKDSHIDNIIEDLKIWDEINVEDIQDQIEELLMDFGYNDVAKEYILYRKDREIIRNQNNDFKNRIKNKLYASNIVNQNANVDEKSFGGRIGEAGRIATKDIALEMMSELSKNNHLNNEIYIHDLDSYAAGEHNCLTLPLDDLLKNGAVVKGRTLRPAGNVSSACQLTAVYFQIQSLEQFGGVAANHYDWTLVPYVRKSFWKYFDKHLYRLTGDNSKSNPEKPIYTKNDDTATEEWNKAVKWALDDLKNEIHQGIEALYHNLNTLLSRSGNQLPFSSLNYGTCTLLEGQMVTEALLRCSIEGIGIHHTTSIFPCGIFQYMKGVNDKPGTPNYYLKKLALESTAKRLYPNYVNVDWSVNAGYDRNDPRTYTATMGCRTYNGFDINGFGQLKDGRGNICPVTIILPTLAMKVKEKGSKLIPMLSNPNWLVDEFLEYLDIKIHEAKDMLIERFEWICSQTPESAKFMYTNNTMYGYKPEEGIRSALIHGTLAVG